MKKFLIAALALMLTATAAFAQTSYGRIPSPGVLGSQTQTLQQGQQKPATPEPDKAAGQEAPAKPAEAPAAKDASPAK